MSGGHKNYRSMSQEGDHGGMGSLENVVTEIPPSRRRFRMRWIPSSNEELEASERKFLSCLDSPYEVQDVDAGEVLQFRGCIGCRVPKLVKVQLPTLFVNKGRPGLPLVLFHGLGLGLGFFVPLIKAVSYPGPVISVDLPGFGRSTRFQFPKNAKDAEATHIKILESWRSSLGLEKFVVAGLSFGGFLGTSYALSYPERVSHLVLIDAWGFPEKPKKITNLMYMENPIVIQMMRMLSTQICPFAMFRLMGPWGKKVWCNFDEDSAMITDQLGDEALNDFNEYTYQCVAKNPTGEVSFRYMSKCFVYSKNPLCRRLSQIKAPITMIVAEKSFVPFISGDEFGSLVGSGGHSEFILIPGATHESIIFCKELVQILGNIIVKEGWADKILGPSGS